MWRGEIKRSEDSAGRLRDAVGANDLGVVFLVLRPVLLCRSLLHFDLHVVLADIVLPQDGFAGVLDQHPGVGLLYLVTLDRGDSAAGHEDARARVLHDIVVF